MLTKFETKSNRVKGLAFHPKRPWILASLHSGVIQLWDYRMGTLLERFDEHEGPVRGVHFHKSQPLFVSGGDDYKIKIWNYNQRRCLFTLLGHLDYIRTVQFHHEYPWIVSSSDDQTIRVWNWQSRTCIAVLTGHNHYVMCAQFHPKEDLIVSASLDQTVRVWDLGALRKKTVAPGAGGPPPSSGDADGLRLPSMGADIFGGNDVVVKYVLEGHDRGVNWASFHPTLPLIVSGADDRQVKLWRMNDTKAWEVDTLRGHVNNVSCVMFHPKHDLIISNSEDKSIRIWDMSKRTGVQTFRREHDRFWILTAHPDMNLLAAGHDSGMLVFKLERERPVFAAQGNLVYFVKDRYLRTFDLASQRDNPILPIRRTGGSALSSGPRSLHYNAAENCVLLTYDAAEGGAAAAGGATGTGVGSYELYPLPKDPRGGAGGEVAVEARRGQGTCAVFVARNRFAVLERGSNTIVIRNLQNEITKKVQGPSAATEAIFYGGTGMVLVRAEDKMIAFDIQQRTVLGELTTPAVKYVHWSQDLSLVALMGKHVIIIADRKLQHMASIHETIRVKSACWDEHGVLIFTTLNHLKYVLPNGDSGIIRTIDVPLYVTKVTGNQVHCLDREGRMRTLAIDNTEYAFKLALMFGKTDRVMEMVRTSSSLVGQSLISYLQGKGYPDVALHFVKDERTRFNLALECGNIDVALACAGALDDDSTWHRLGQEALRQGNAQIVEYCYQKTKNFERLSFLYLITGAQDKLRKMLKIAEMRGDVMSRFHNALYLGDAKERVAVLKDAGLKALAYACARNHGLEEEAAALAEELGPDKLPQGLPPPNPLALTPLEPVWPNQANWPQVPVGRGFFDRPAGSDMQLPAGVSGSGLEGLEGEADAAAEGGWGAADLDVGTSGGAGGAESVLAGDGGWDAEELDIPPELAAKAAEASLYKPAAPGAGSAASAAAFTAPTAGIPATQRWGQGTSIPGELVAAGDFDTAMRVLTRQVGIVNFAPIKQHFLDIYQASHAYVPTSPAAAGPGGAFTAFAVHLDRTWQNDVPTQPPSHPAVSVGVRGLQARVQGACKLVTEGRFTDAVRLFSAALQMAPLAVAGGVDEADQIKEVITTCREYLIGLRCELKRKEMKEEDPLRQLELAAYFTHCVLQPRHLALALRSAMTISFKLKCFQTCSHFCRRLIELNADEKMTVQARQVLAACEANPKDDIPQPLNYDPRTPFDICSVTFTPIYRGSRAAVCPLTGAKFQTQCAGQISPLGDIAQIGADAAGLINVRS